jgi:hypothetical protein
MIIMDEVEASILWIVSTVLGAGPGAGCLDSMTAAEAVAPEAISRTTSRDLTFTEVPLCH